MGGGVLAIVFEGGQAPTMIESEMASIRREICLDTLERLASAPLLSGVTLVTSSGELARDAGLLGIECELSPAGGFHLGRRLDAIIGRRQPGSVICMGGASVPLATSQEFAMIARQLQAGEKAYPGTGCVIANNLVSADIVGFTPAGAIRRIDPPESDNFLAYLLREAGLQAIILPGGPVFGMDADTPVDLAILAHHRNAGGRTTAAVKRARWLEGAVHRVERALAAMRERHCRVFVSGRTGPAVQAFIGENLQWRLRIVSEERGLKAVGPGGGRATSVIGRLIDLMGARRFFEYLEELCDVALLDTRVIFAHRGLTLSQSDRFNSDLLQVDVVAEPWVRQFTEAAARCRIPVLLGGHSLVNGGAWVLAEKVRQELTTSSRSLSLRF